MIGEKIVKLSDVVFVFSKPPEKALIGVVDRINYPIITVKVVKRDEKNKFKEEEEIDLSKDVPLSILSEDMINRYLTAKEFKRLKKIKDDDSVDMFAGMH